MNSLLLIVLLVLWLGVYRIARARDWFDYFVGSELAACGLIAGMLLFAPVTALSAWWIIFVVLFTVVESVVLVAFLVRARHGQGPHSPGEEVPEERIEVEGEFAE